MEAGRAPYWWLADQIEHNFSQLQQKVMAWELVNWHFAEDWQSLEFRHPVFGKRAIKLDGQDHSLYAFALGRYVTVCASKVSSKVVVLEVNMGHGQLLTATASLQNSGSMKLVMDMAGKHETFSFCRPCPTISTCRSKDKKDSLSSMDSMLSWIRGW